MTVLFWLLGISLCLGTIGLAAFMWCVRAEQFDDLEGAAQRVLFDE